MAASGNSPLLPSATVATLQAFVAQTRSTVGPQAKTMLVIGGAAAAAQVAATIAGDLQRELVHVPLSTTVSKTIGETEKNLDRVFDAAVKSGAVLFLDEADALFGKRTDVKDSHDRYANLTIDGLLQRIESHAGVAILATRKKHALDGAFTRHLASITHVEPD